MWYHTDLKMYYDLIEILKTKLAAHFLLSPLILTWTSVTACIISFTVAGPQGCCQRNAENVNVCSCLLLMFFSRIMTAVILCLGVVPYCAFIVRPRAQLVFSVPLANSGITFFSGIGEVTCLKT